MQILQAAAKSRVIILSISVMRLASEYLIKNKKVQQQQEIKGRKYIVKLGKGLPSSSISKRGISLSHSLSKLSKNSKSQHQTYKFSMQARQLQHASKLVAETNQKTRVYPPLPTNKHAQPNKKPEQKLYPQKNTKADTYAQQHIFQHQIQPTQKQSFNQQILSKVKSLQNIVNQQKMSYFTSKGNSNANRNIMAIRTPSKLHNVGPPRHDYHLGQRNQMIQTANRVQSQLQQHTVSRRIYIDGKLIQYPYADNFKSYQSYHNFDQRKIVLQIPSSHHVQYFPSTPICQVRSCNKLTELQLVDFPKLIAELHAQTVPQRNSSSSRKKMYLTRDTKTSEIMQASNAKDDPYNIGYSKYENIRANAFKPTSHGVIANPKDHTSSNKFTSRDSRPSNNSWANSNQLLVNSKMGSASKSLWDANKTESILSNCMKESAEFQIQQSFVTKNFFSPPLSQ